MTTKKQVKFGQQTLLIILLATVVLLGGCTTQTQKTYRVGILSGLDPLTGIADSFKTKMTELGYVEGNNIVYDVQKTNFEPDKERQILEKFVNDKVDLILTFPTEVSLEAKAATQGTGIPVVFSYSTIEDSNLVESVRYPGGNITGVRETGPDIFVKRLEILHELAPGAKRVYITYNPNVPPVPPALDALRKAAPLMNITLVENPVTTAEEIEADLQARNKSADIGMDAMLIMAEPLSVSPPVLEATSKFAAEHKIPIGGVGRMSIEKDGLPIIFSYEIYTEDVGKLAAISADKVLRGTPAGTIPVVTPEARLLINYKVIQGLGLNVSEGMLSRADKIIQ